MNTPYGELLLALRPEICLVAGALAVLAVDLPKNSRSPQQRLQISAALGVLALVTAGVWGLGAGQPGPLFGGVLSLDMLAQATRAGVLGLALLALGVTAGTSRLRHPAELVAMILFATTGFTLMAVAQQLLLAFLALETASLSLYVLAGFDKSRPESAEAALKYFLVGGVSAAFLLFGFSLLYGLTGSIELQEISVQLAMSGPSPLLVVALVMILVAFGFKAAAAPFHLWAPDVYEGAPAPSAALIASASKLAGLALFLRLLWPGLGAAAGNLTGAAGWLPVVALISAASMLLGNFAALAQGNVRRLLAYSAIAHAGALLLGVIAAGHSGPGPLFYYAATYGLATVGAFGVIAVVERAGRCQNLGDLGDLAGLRARSPLLAGCLFVFVLSLAGIPPLAGFVGKFVVFSAALQMGGPAGWLALLAIALSAVALYYYLLILKQALVAPAKESSPIKVPATAALALLAAAALIVVLGLWPSALLGLFQ
ncbi:MAG: NADH-quinone oxidoreductase subunit N [Lacunisphaera sp.]|nr:NADH-quinone oxidoreductase subunit N [Lacunisphaera sp.]